MPRQRLRLVIVPSDPITSYEKKGISSWLEAYYNPQKLFQEVFALSPLEHDERFAYGMTIRGVNKKDFLHTLKEIKPDVVRAYGGYWPADLACQYRLPNVPVIVSVHDTNPCLLHKSMRYADLVICMSKAVEKQVLALGIDSNKIRILPNRVDLQVFKPIGNKSSIGSEVAKIPPGKHILHVGRKSHEKNLDTLIRSLKLLPQEYYAVFVGGGDSAPFLSLAEEEGVSNRCFWIESIKNQELPLWYSSCDCVCVPSRREGFGLVFIEAAACGAPIVTSDIAPMNEYLQHDVSACLVKDFENPEALSHAIQKTCEDNHYRRTISEGAVKAARPFDRHIVDKTEASMYQEALKLEPLQFSLSQRIWLTAWKIQRRANSFRRRVTALIRRHLIWFFTRKSVFH
jgi:glycosyltransferase involved in cell wall biosynthesis